MFKRFTAALWLLVLVSFVAGCGGGGGDDRVSVSPNVTSLQFSGIAGDSIQPQHINVELTNASGTVYALIEVADPGVAIASFSITGSTSATITVQPAFGLAAGTYRTTVFLRVYRNQNGTDLLASFSYPITITLQASLAVNPTSLALSTVEGGSAQGSLAITVGPGVPGTLVTTLAPGQPGSPWLNLSLVGNTLQVSASAVSLPAGVYQRELEVSLVQPGSARSVRVPFTFTVGVGLVAPADKTLALDINTPEAALSGTVSVVRADGNVSAWTATSSAPWLSVTPSGSTPGTLVYAVDKAQAIALRPYTDSTITVTISAPGLTPVSFNVTLQNRLPYVSSVGPYGLAAGSPARIVVGGRGFNQVTDPVAMLQLSGLTVHSASVLSDTQIEASVTAQVGGQPFGVRVPNASGIVTPAAQTVFSSVFSYPPALVARTGANSIYVHDPVRRAVFVLSREDNVLLRYQFDTVGNSWVITPMPHAQPLNMALAPDGQRIWLTDLTNKVVEVNPDTMTVLNLYIAPFGISQNVGGALPVSSDGRLWLPGGAHYFDLVTRSFETFNGNAPQIDFGGYHGSLDGSLVIISPSFAFSPRPPYAVYEPVNGLVSNPMGSTELGYEPRLSVDGSRTLDEFTGQLYNRNFALLGQVPAASDKELHFLMTLTPDGNKILVLHKVFDNTSFSHLVSQSIDVYSTTTFAQGTTDFAKVGSIPISTDTSVCNFDCFYGNLYLLPSVDSKTLFWFGNRNMQVFGIP